MPRSLVLIAAAAVLAAPAPALAQQQQCFATPGGRMVCMDGMDAVVDRTARAARARPVDDASGAGPALTPRQQRLVAAVAKAVMAGRCERAETLAIKEGDLPLAEEAVRLCVPGRETRRR